MRRLSTGDESNLGNWLKMVKAMSPIENSKAHKLIKDKIKNSPNGEKEEVVAEESQLLSVLMNMMFEEAE